MDFQQWQQWKGAEVASFICTICDLPQYRTVIRQNLTGRSLLQLATAQMLNKGLALAGICDVDHQRSIAGAVAMLMESAPDDLAMEFDRLGGNLPRAPICGRLPQKPQPPKGAAPTRGRRPWVVVPEGGLLLPRMQSTTEESLQEARPDFGHESEGRLTPRPAEQSDWYAKPWGQKEDATVSESPRKLQLRQRLGRTEDEYVRMREADNPTELGIGIVFGLRAVQCLHARRAADGL